MTQPGVDVAGSERAAFKQLVNVSYWATCHEDHEKSWKKNKKDARLYVDPITGICRCCNVNYHRAEILAHLDELRAKYPNDVLIQLLHAEAHEWGDDGTLVANIQKRKKKQ
jgi:hypothetical protein